MKIRYGHVSNSSTSSFIIVGKEALEASNLSEDSFIELNKKQIRQVVKEVDEFKWNKKDHVFLTRFFSDCGPTYDQMFINKLYEYEDGSWSGPYSEGYFINLNGLSQMEGIWIRKKGMI